MWNSITSFLDALAMGLVKFAVVVLAWLFVAMVITTWYKPFITFWSTV